MTASRMLLLLVAAAAVVAAEPPLGRSSPMLATFTAEANTTLSTTAARLTNSGVCASAANTTAWVFAAPSGHSYSCASTAGGTNDLGTAPTMCDGDPASVRMAVTPGKAECLEASAKDCKIPMHDFTSLDYDFSIDGCDGIWAAPLWMTPDTWRWGGGSGEVDSLEFCSRDSAHLNFAGGGHQVKLGGLSLGNSSGHITVRKDAAGIITITACTKAEAASSALNMCAAPVYKDCPACLDGNNAYGCWCTSTATTTTNNIYDSGGCAKGSDCTWSLESDLWNGVSGDAGYAGCMTEVPGVVDKGKPNLKSSCALSVEKIVLRGGGANGSLRWGAGSPAKCSALTPKALTPKADEQAKPDLCCACSQQQGATDLFLFTNPVDCQSCCSKQKGGYAKGQPEDPMACTNAPNMVKHADCGGGAER